MKVYDLVAGQPWAADRSAFMAFSGWAADSEIPAESLAAYQGKSLDGAERASTRDGVATIPIRGMIYRHDTPLTRFVSEVFGGSITDVLAADFNAALANPRVRQILLQVDSPGGHAAGIGELAHMIHASSKPVVAYVGSQGASAAYYLASAASAVVVDPAAMLGSIGVVFGIPPKRPSDPMEIVSSQSPDKRVDPQTEAGKAKLQATADAMADVFISDVAKFRGVSPDRVASDFGRGGTLLGHAAVEAGMADHVSSYEDTLARMGRGETISRKPARKASKTHKEPAMSEQQTPPVAGDPIAAENADLRKRLADADARALASERLTADAVRKGIQIEAQAFATDIISGQCKAVPTEQAAIVAAMTLALQADHAHPVAGSPNAHADAIKAIYAARTKHTLTVEKTASNPAQEGTALASDPAAGQKTAAEADLERLEASTRALGKRMNGHN